MGATVWDGPSVETLPYSQILTNLAAANGAGLIGHGDDTVAAQMRFDLRKFGGSPSASGVNNTQAFLDAIDEINNQGVAGHIWLGAGQWEFAGTANTDGIVDGFYIPYTGFSTPGNAIEIWGEGRKTEILAGTNNMIQCRYSACFGGLQGITFNANGKTGVNALYVGHDSTTDTSAAQTQEHNSFSRIWVKGGHAKGFWLRPGCHAGGVDSQVLSNDFTNFYIQNATRCILLDDNANNTVGTSNRNNFVFFAVGQTGTEIGIEIRTGAQNNFTHGVINGVDTGVKTGALIENTGMGGLANDLNCFDKVNCENNVTYDMNNANANTQVIAGFWNFVTKFTGTMPGLIIPSAGYVSFMPMRLPGITYGEGVPGFSSGSLGLTKSINDTAYPIATDVTWSTADFTNITSIAGVTTSITESLNAMVDWQFAMVFQATAGGTRITILAASIPFTPLASIYKNPDVDNPLFVAFVNNGTNRSQALCGFTSTGDFFIDVPSGGNFNDTSNSNAVSFSVRVRRA